MPSSENEFVILGDTPAAAAPTSPVTATGVREAVKSAYGKVAAGESSCCGPTSSCCAGPGAGADEDALVRAFGYTEVELEALPDGANLGLSCGNPGAIAALQPGEVVLDLGAGAGFDVFLAAARVGNTGHVHGVDMTREMVKRARGNAVEFRKRTGLENVTFHLGEIEALPLPDASVDAVISNCVLNLSPEQDKVWREIGRVLKPGGRVAISDIALRRPLPAAIKADVEALVGCIAGASLLEDTLNMMRDAGLTDVKAETHDSAITAMLDVTDPLAQKIMAEIPAGTGPSDFATSALFSARKPA